MSFTKCFKFINFFFFLYFFFLIYPAVHIIGDSHAAHFFCPQHSYLLLFQSLIDHGKCSFDEIIAINNEYVKMPVFIHWLGPITMHRIGRDGLEFLNIEKFDVAENDILVFVFGEIDIRCHILKQRDKTHQTEGQIIKVIAENYINTILKNKKKYKNIKCIVCSIIPPVAIDTGDKEFPYYGTLQERIQITKYLNAELIWLCNNNNLLFLDTYRLFANNDGSLNAKYLDDSIHIKCEFNEVVRRMLWELSLG